MGSGGVRHGGYIIYIDKVLHPFDNLCAKYDIAAKQFLLYTTLTVAVHMIWGQCGVEPKLLHSCCFLCNTFNTSHLILGLYTVLQEDACSPIMVLQGHLEEDLGASLSDGDCTKMWEVAPKISCNAHFKLIHFYVLHRAYSTPKKLSVCFPLTSPDCPCC